MKSTALFVIASLATLPIYAEDNTNQQIQKLQKQTLELQKQLNQLQRKLAHHTPAEHPAKPRSVSKAKASSKAESNTSVIPKIHNSNVYVHTLDKHPESVEFYPTALLAENHVVTFIAGTPVVTAPYLGSRPAFDGSDYIVNISSINRDIRLMQQRRRLYNAYKSMGYPAPNTPIVTLSGKAEPIGRVGDSYARDMSADWDLGSAELDAAAALNDKVEAYVSLAYDSSPPDSSNQRTANSSVGLGMGFINIGDLDESPYYFTAGQIYVPFGRFSTSMISAPITMMMGRTKSRPFILGYQSQGSSGPFAAIYGFKGDTTLGDSGVGGLNAGYAFNTAHNTGEIGASVISSINNAGGMQANGSGPTLFGGFSSLTNGNERVKEIPAVDVHGILRFDRYNFMAEWVGVTESFRAQDLSFNGHGAKPQAIQLEGAATFMAFSKPSSFALGYQWSKETLALRLPKHRASAVFNISIWKDTVESLEYRHDIDYKQGQYANGAAPPGFINANTYGTGKSSDTVLAQIGVYF